MKNNKNLILIAIITSLVILTGVIYLYSTKNKIQRNQLTNDNQQQDQRNLERNLNENNQRDNDEMQRPNQKSPRGNGQGMQNEGNGQGIRDQQIIEDDYINVPDAEYDEITMQAQDAILAALDDEYKAYATYDAIINKFGDVRPFSMIINSEQQHINSLITLLNRYNIEVPQNEYLNNIQVTDSVAQACAIGVTAEIENAALYRETLIPAVEQYNDIKTVFEGLMNASQTKHLPAFERCAN